MTTRSRPIGSRTCARRAASRCARATANWKNVGDNYSDGLHIAVAHPGLKRLMGDGYGVDSTDHVDKMWGPILERPSPNRSERAYQKFLPPVPHLPEERQRLWIYFKLWPNFAFDIYPDQIDFMQWLPLSPTETLIREISYALPDEPARDEGGALSQLAHQPPGQP